MSQVSASIDKTGATRGNNTDRHTENMTIDHRYLTSLPVTAGIRMVMTVRLSATARQDIRQLMYDFRNIGLSERSKIVYFLIV